MGVRRRDVRRARAIFIYVAGSGSRDVGDVGARAAATRARDARHTATTSRPTHEAPHVARRHTPPRTTSSNMFARTIGRARPARATPADKRADKRAAATRAMTRPVALGDARAVFTTSAFRANAVERARDVRARGARRSTVMAAKVAGYIKLAIEAGKASPAPPIGPALGAKVRENISFDATTARAGRARGRARGRGGRTRAAGEGGRPRRERVSRGDASARGTTAGGDARARWRGRRARDGSMVAGDARGAVGTRVVR